MLETTRKLSMPFSFATLAMTSKQCATMALFVSSTAATDLMCCFGITRKWVGACGSMSLNA